MPPIPYRAETMRIAGRKVDTAERVPVFYPFTGEEIGSVPAGQAEHAREAFAIAAACKPGLTRHQRQQILMNAARIIAARKAELAPVIVAELGISLADALYECGRACDVYALAGQLCIQDDGEAYACDISPHGKARRIFTLREPLRAISAITPFNHPLNMVSHKIAPAIATNNCIVVKPTELTPLTTLWLADVLYEAGLPPEMLSVVTGWPNDIGDEMITNPDFELITFTGGVPVGKMIAAKAVYKRQVLELGGNDPLIVLDDLGEDDLALAADLFSGQTGSNPDENRALTAAVRENPEAMVANLDAAVAFLRARDDVTGRVGAMGWCFGGGVALSWGLDGEHHEATAIFYGQLLDDPDLLARLPHEVYGTFAREDRGPSPEQVERFRDALDAAGVAHDLHIYDEVNHGFWLHVDQDAELRAAPALDAWERLKAYLGRTLR